eukprot:15472234-Alexandrium_andersonii.AAC.1
MDEPPEVALPHQLLEGPPGLGRILGEGVAQLCVGMYPPQFRPVACIPCRSARASIAERTSAMPSAVVSERDKASKRQR